MADNCRTCGATDAAPVTIAGDRDLLCHGCARYWRELAHYQAQLEQQYLTAQLASGTPAKPSTLKPAQSGNLFEPVAETGSLF